MCLGMGSASVQFHLRLVNLLPCHQLRQAEPDSLGTPLPLLLSGLAPWWQLSCPLTLGEVQGPASSVGGSPSPGLRLSGQPDRPRPYCNQ